MNTNHTTHEEFEQTLTQALSAHNVGAIGLSGAELSDLYSEPFHRESLCVVSLEEVRDLDGTLDRFELMEAAYEGYGNADIERGVDAQGGIVFGNVVPQDRACWENFDPSDMVR